MRKFHLLTLFTLLCSYLLSSIAAAQSPLINTAYNLDKRTTAKLTALFSRLPSSGYLPLRLEVKNNQKTERSWKVKFISNAHQYSYSGNETPKMKSEFIYTCPPGESKTFDIIVPIATSIPDVSMNNISNSLEIELISEGDAQKEVIQSSQTTTLPTLLLSSDLFIQHSSNLDSLATHSSSSSYRGHDTRYASSFDPAQMPSDWKAYSGYDSIVCTDSDWTSMEKATQSAILEWNRLGGRLIILRLNNASNFKTLGISSASGDIAKTNLSRSFGTLSLIDISRIDHTSIPDVIRKQVETPIANQARHHAIVNDYDGGKWSIKNALGKLSFNPTFLIIILIVFGILVGPVNLFVFAKSGQRHKLFITTPIIAIGASLILILIIILQDGFGGHGNRIQLVEVRADDGENKAYVKQEQIARTGVVLGSSFETSSPVYITPVPLKSSRYSRVTQRNQGGNANYLANHGKNGLSVSGDWFQSRSEQGHYLESVIPTRGRISKKGTALAPAVNSSFDYTIQTLLYRGEGGMFWKAEALASGETVTLTSISTSVADTLIDQYAKQLTPTLANHLMKLSTRNDHFIAFSENAPAIDTLDSINWQNTTSIITGPLVK